MKNDKEIEMLLNEIPHATLHHQHQQHGIHGSSLLERTHGMYGMFDDDLSTYHHHKYTPVSPVSGFNLQSEGSSSSLVSGWFSSDDGSPRPTTMLDDIKPQTQTSFVRTPYLNGLRSDSKSPDDSPLGRNSIENLMNEMSKLHFRDGVDDSSTSRRFGSEFRYPVRTDYNNVEENRVFDSYRNGFSDVGRVDHSFPLSQNSFNEERTSALLTFQQNRLNDSFPMSPRSFNEERSSALLRLQQNCHIATLPEAPAFPSQYDYLFSPHAQCPEPLGFTRRQTMEETLRNLQLQADSRLSRNYYDSGNRFSYTSPSQIRPSMSDPYLYAKQNLMYNHQGIANLRHSQQQLRMPLDVESSVPYCFPRFNERTEATPQDILPSSPSVESSTKLEAFNCEDSIIIQGKGLHYVIKKRRERSKEQQNEIGIPHLKEGSPKFADPFFCSRSSVRSSETGCNMSMYNSLSLPTTYNSLSDIRDYIYFMAKDQHGCRFLQQKIEEGSPQDKQMIFQEIIDHVVELMTNPFGNYLVQKLLEKCSAEQRMKVLLMVTNRPGELVRISLNMHGTRAVQKLINTLKSWEERSVVISALEPGFLDLIKDLNGNHVLQHCLQHLQNEENKFIFTSAAKFCFDIATHRHGCCVLQRCIAYARGEDRETLVSKVSSNGLRLAQDAFGNYVVQFVLELKIPSANANLMSQFEGKFAQLSTQKFSSNVIEKCLKVFGEEGRSMIINELISSSQFELLLQDPYANYVIQSALKVSKGSLNDALVESIRPYATVLKTNPYCKKIFSWTGSKK